MGKFNNLLNLRLKFNPDAQKKMHELAERSSKGDLSSFAGLFQVTALAPYEQEKIRQILLNFQAQEEGSIDQDLLDLSHITSEVKAITTQAVLLHGERIKKAQTILKRYKDGAFTAFLMATYGNRQTPYNFLQYYEFYTSMPAHLKAKIHTMPRQAVYTLASRPGESSKKEQIVTDYEGEPKEVLLTLIRQIFPLDEDDKRHTEVAAQVIEGLKKIVKLTSLRRFKPRGDQQEEISLLIARIKERL